MTPTPRPNLQPDFARVMTKLTTHNSRVKVVSRRPFDWTGTTVRANSMVPKRAIEMIDLSSHGSPRQTRMSKMLDPNRLQRAILARPARFTTITEEITSGMEDPAARIVNPRIV